MSYLTQTPSFLLFSFLQHLSRQSELLCSFIKHSTSDAFRIYVRDQRHSVRRRLSTKEAYGTASTVKLTDSIGLAIDLYGTAQPCRLVKEIPQARRRTLCKVLSTCRLLPLQQTTDTHSQDSKLSRTRMMNLLKLNNQLIQFDGGQTQCPMVSHCS